MIHPKKQGETCKYCYNKRFYSILIGIRGANDFRGEGFDELPSIKNIACPRCNEGNCRRIKGVRKSIWR